MITRRLLLAVSLLLPLNVLASARGQERVTTSPTGILKQGQRVAIVGDSITEQKLYSKYIELYLTACLPDLDLHVIQLGWSGERAIGFQGRMDNDLLPFQPDVVTTCYGMNDGGYGPYSDDVGAKYRDPMAEIVKRLKERGATVIVGSPGAVDYLYFRRGQPNQAEITQIYNGTLGKLRDIAREIAVEQGMIFANVHDTMLQAMVQAQAKLGDAYNVCGGDGFHPGPNGQLLMAYAFLNAMRFDGQIGTITLDLGGDVEASAGHKVVAREGGQVEVESARWPFCFTGDETSPGGTRSILPFVPFNADLNRLVLVVKNLKSDRARVTWGDAAQEFTREQLEQGVNLAEAFAAGNPFSGPFARLEELVGAKQAYETQMIKEAITRFPALARLAGDDAEVAGALKVIRERLQAGYEERHQKVRAGHPPVRHTIMVTPL